MTKREKMERADAEMRAFYESFGVSSAVIEAAIRQRHLFRPTEEDPPVLAAKLLGRKKFRALTGRKTRTDI
jgi:hypothetical protein